jgi:hypothetical protein
MFKSLFGDLTPQRERHVPDDDAADNDFASTAVMGDPDGDDGDGNDDDRAGLAPEGRHQRDLFVTGSPVQAMRAHFASTRDEAGPTTRLITLHDPAGMWAGAVVKALSDASGQPVERLQLRDQGSLDTLAVIERTTLPRRLDDTLKVYHADLRLQGQETDLIPLALMEHSDLAAVIVGPMTPSAIDDMLATLNGATRGENWRCAQLLFMLPVGAMWIAHKIDALSWPAKVQVVMLSEPLTSASAVWNKVLAHWNRVKPGQPDAPTTAPASGFMPSGMAPLAEPRATQRAELLSETVLVQPPAPPAAVWPMPGSPGAADAAARVPDPQRALVILRELMLLDGLIFASLVDAATGLVVASDAQGPDIDRAAASATEILRVHRRTLRQMGHSRPNDPVDEVLVTAGNRYHILRTLQAHPDYFILAVLDKLRSNLAMTRFRIMEAQQVLA